MDTRQADLFGAGTPLDEAPNEEVAALVPGRPRKSLALVQGAETMPWTDVLDIIREDNDFRYAKDSLPADEGAALWAAFDVEMNRLCAIMNAGKEMDTDADPA